MKKFLSYIMILFLSFVLAGCSYFEGSNLQNAGILFETEVDENAWSEKGYDALVEIENDLRVDGLYKENVQSEEQIKNAVNDFIEEGVNLIIGHGNAYGSYFVDMSEQYPDIHFIYTNGGEYNSSVTSLNFNSHAMGFFSGMAAGEMSSNNHVGVIAAYAWQPEVEGFYEGVKYQNPKAEVSIDYVNDWNDEQYAFEIYDQFIEEDVDVIYPASDGFSQSMIQKAAEDGVYSIGYTADQSDIAPEYVLTSTIQHIDHIYIDIVKEFNKGGLPGDIRVYDFQNEFISLGTFNDDYSNSFLSELKEGIEKYKETNLLPNERFES